ncbi:hypothetical protein GGF32_002448 [Allomyces javanicus]|nr:hypothetical protein GGF32_002448 [Allomyces javanicus]
MPLLQYLRVDILAGGGASATPLACHADMDRILASAESAARSPLQYYGILAAPTRITACSLFLQNNSPVHAYRARIWLGANPWATHHLRPGGACTVPGLLATLQAGKGAMMKVEWHQAQFLSGQDRGPGTVRRAMVVTNAIDQPNVPYDVGGMLWELLEAAPSTVFELDCSALVAHVPLLVPSASCSAIQQPPRTMIPRTSQSSANLPITTGMTTRPRAAAASLPPPPSSDPWGADVLRPSNVVFPSTALAPPSQPTHEVVELLDSDDDPMDVDDEPIIFTPVPPPPAAPLRARVRPTRTAAPTAPSRTTMTPPLATSIRLGTARAAAMQRAEPEVIVIDSDSD